MSWTTSSEMRTAGATRIARDSNQSGANRPRRRNHALIEIIQHVFKQDEDPSAGYPVTSSMEANNPVHAGPTRTTEVNPTVTQPAKVARALQGSLARVGLVEGYLSLALLVALFLFGGLLSLLPEAFGTAISITFCACSLLFATSGARHGTGGARVAARGTLVAWLLLIALRVALLFH
jgi:hypothetical protein